MKCVKPAVSGEAKTQESTTTWHIRWLKEKPVMGKRLGMFGWKMVKRFLQMHVGASYKMALSRTNCIKNLFYNLLQVHPETLQCWNLFFLEVADVTHPRLGQANGSPLFKEVTPFRAQIRFWQRHEDQATKDLSTNFGDGFLEVSWTACFLCFLHAASACRNFDTISLHALQLRPSPAKLLSMLEVEVDACAPVAWANPNATSIDEFHHLSAPSLKIWWVGGDR